MCLYHEPYQLLTPVHVLEVDNQHKHPFHCKTVKVHNKFSADPFSKKTIKEPRTHICAKLRMVICNALSTEASYM